MNANAIWRAVALALVMGGLAANESRGAGEKPPAVRPTLVVVVSIDQFPYEYLQRFRPNFAPDGMFLKFRKDGATFFNCHHGHAVTKTAPGHSVLLTGAFPNVNGIVGNEWFDRTLGRRVYCVEDRDYRTVGNLAPAADDPDAPYSPRRAAGSRPDGVSARSLIAGTLGDVMKLANPAAKVFGIALKDRAAVLMAGHAADGVFWFDDDNGNWVTSTYYARSLPPYLRNYNESPAGETFAGQNWELLLEQDRYLQYAAPTLPAFAPRPGFPHVLPTKAGPGYYKALATSPFGNQFTLDSARLIIASEKLGQDDVTDLLAINLSSNDYVGHAYGPHSLEVQDITLHTDRQLAEFARLVEEELKGRPWVMALSSDHGVAPVPEYAVGLRLPAERDPLGNVKKAEAALEVRLVEQLGSLAPDRTYIQACEDGQVYLDHSLPELRGERLIVAQRIVRDWLYEQPDVAVAFIREELLAQNATGGLALAFQRTLHGQRSGDVLYALRPYTLAGSSTANHGSPWEYDSHVPLLFWGAGIRPGRFDTATTPASLAPTLARLIGVDPPSCCAVPALGEALASPAD